MKHAYPKIWTSLLEKDWWLEANGSQRLTYLMLILACKSKGDVETTVWKSWGTLGDFCGMDRRTVATCVRHWCDKGEASLEQNCHGTIYVTMRNYLKNQKRRDFKADKNVTLNENKNKNKNESKTRPNGTQAFDYQFKIPEIWEWYLDATNMKDVNIGMGQENKSAITKILMLVNGSIMKAKFIIRGGLHNQWNQDNGRLDLPWIARDEGKMLNWLMDAKAKYPRKFEYERDPKKYNKRIEDAKKQTEPEDDGIPF